MSCPLHNVCWQNSYQAGASSQRSTYRGRLPVILKQRHDHRQSGRKGRIQQKSVHCVSAIDSLSKLEENPAELRDTGAHSQESPADEKIDEEKVKELAKRYGARNHEIKALGKKVKKGLRGTSVYFVGMMGSGKTTVAKLVASALDYVAVDTDTLAEQLTKKKVSEIFEEEGEESFRELETQIMKEVMAYTGTVVSTGGGVVLSRLNWGYMQHAIIIWLHGPPELLARRALKDGASSRPLLHSGQIIETNGKDEEFHRVRDKLAAILKDREGKYAQADIKISLEDLNNGKTGANAGVVAQRALQAIKDRVEGDRRQEPGQKKGFGKQSK